LHKDIYILIPKYGISIMTKLHTKNRQMASRRAVAPVIATLLLVAIAVVGGSIIFVFSQGFFSSAQISGQPQVESIEFVGYDASDVEVLTLHDGVFSDGDGTTATFDGAQDDAIASGERIAVYVQNQSAQKVTLTEVRLAGTEYFYNTTAGLILPPNDDASDGAYWVVTRGDTTDGGILSDGIVGELEAGQEATIVIDLLGGIQQGRDAQFKITTANGNIFVGTIVASQQSG
jgi:flagellin-like protein